MAVSRPADQARVLQHLQVLGHRLHRDAVGRGELSDRRVARREAGHEVAAGGIGQRREDPGQGIGHVEPQLIG